MWNLPFLLVSLTILSLPSFAADDDSGITADDYMGDDQLAMEMSEVSGKGDASSNATSAENDVQKKLPGFEGKIGFTEKEKRLHLASISQLNSEASSCLMSHLERNQEFFKKYKIAAYYGTESNFNEMSLKQRKAFLKKRGLSPDLVKELQQMSCVNLALKCLSFALEQTGQKEVNKKLRKFVIQNGKDGTAMQIGLQQLGWKILYWNPNPAMNKQWDKDEKKQNPKNEEKIWGYHEFRYSTVMGKNKMYHYNPVDDATTLVNFGEATPEFLKSEPYFIGTVHTGFHVFSGFNGFVVEAHSNSDIIDAWAVEGGPFNPLAKTDQHPDAEDYGSYRSGLIAIPPSY